MKLALHDLSWLCCTPTTFVWNAIEIIPQNYAKAQLVFINHTLVGNKIPKQIKIISAMSQKQNGEELALGTLKQLSDLISKAYALLRGEKLAAIANNPLPKWIKYIDTSHNFDQIIFVLYELILLVMILLSVLPTKNISRSAECDTICQQNYVLHSKLQLRFSLELQSAREI